MLEHLTIEDKLNYIDGLKQYEYLSDDNWNALINLANDEENEIRLNVSEVLALFPSKKSEELLLHLLNDSDYLVRASACDSISFSTSQEILRELFFSASDKKFLVRGYAVLSIGDIQLKLKSDFDIITQHLKELEKKEKSKWVKIAIYRSLYKLGDLSYSEKLLDMIEDRYYKNRIFTLSLIEELVDDNQYYETNKLRIIIKKRLDVETAYSVKLKLYKVLEKIDNNPKIGDGSVIDG